MAHLSATVVLLSLLAVAHGARAMEADLVTDAELTAIDDEEDPANPTVVPAEEVPAEQHGFLRLPSHRRHRQHPCHHGLSHRHLWWAHHHGLFRDARRFHGHGEAHQAHMDVPAVVANVPREVQEVKAVAEPDPDRSLPNTDGEGELARESFRDGHEAHEDEDAPVMAWKKDMLWKRFHHGLRHHHHRRHHDREEQEEGAGAMKRFHHDDDEEEDEEKKMRKRFHFHDHHDEDEEEKKMTKRFHHAEHDDSDSDDEDDQMEEMVRQFRKAIMRRRIDHGRRSHHHQGHRHAEEAEKADGEEESGVMSWIKGLMKRF